MKNLKFKKLIILTMLAALTSTVSVGAMEGDYEKSNQLSKITTENNEEISQDYLSKIEEAKKIYENQQEKYQEMKELCENLKNDYENVTTKNLIENFNKNYEKYEKFVNYMGYNNEPDVDEAYGRREDGSYYQLSFYYKGTMFKELDKAIELIRNIKTSEEAQTLAKNIVILKEDIRILLYSYTGNSYHYINSAFFNKHFCCTFKTILYEIKYCLNNIKNEGTEAIKDSFLKLLDRIDMSDSNKKHPRFNNTFEYEVNEKDIEIEANKYENLSKFVNKVILQYNKMKNIIDLVYYKKYDKEAKSHYLSSKEHGTMNYSNIPFLADYTERFNVPYLGIKLRLFGEDAFEETFASEVIEECVKEIKDANKSIENNAFL